MAGQWSSGGLMAGYEFSDVTMWAGVSAGYGRTAGTVPSRLSSFEMDALQTSIYGGWTEGQWTFAGAAGYQTGNLSSQRRVVFGAIDRLASANYWTHAATVSGEVSYAVDFDGGTRLMPLASLNGTLSGHNGFSETGAGVLNLTGSAGQAFTLETGLGLGLSHEMDIEAGTLTLSGAAVWEHAVLNDSSPQSLTLAGSPLAFPAQGSEAARDRLKLGLGAGLDLGNGMTISAAYQARLSGAD